MMKRLKLGVTGHRKLSNLDTLKKLLQFELYNLSKKYKFETRGKLEGLGLNAILDSAGSVESTIS